MEGRERERRWREGKRERETLCDIDVWTSSHWGSRVEIKVSLSAYIYR